MMNLRSMLLTNVKRSSPKLNTLPLLIANGNYWMMRHPKQKIKSADLFEKIGSHCVIPIAIEKKVDWTKTPQVPHHKYFIDKFQESLLTLSWFHNVHFDDNKTCQNVILMSSTIPKHKYIIKK